MNSTLIIRPADRELCLVRAQKFLAGLSAAIAWEVQVRPWKKRRSTEQNRYLWGVVYQTIMDSSQEMDGWDANDLHDFFLGEHFGWESVAGFGRKKLRPIRRSSKLTPHEFMDYIAHIQRFMAERGIYIPDPNENQR